MLVLTLASVFTLGGRCYYPASLGSPLVGETRAICDSVMVDGDGAGTVIEFAHRSTTQFMRFMGRLEGSRLTVHGMESTRVAARPARGSCTLFQKNGKVSGVSCVAQGEARSFVANFLATQM